MRRVLLVAVVGIALSLGGVVRIATAASIDDPYGYFNVYSLGNIGTSINPYTSDFQGVAGAAGDAHFFDFGLHAVGPATPYSLYTGGDASLTKGSFLNGGVESHGSAFLDYFYVAGNVAAGNEVTGGRSLYVDPVDAHGGSVAGSIFAQNGVHLTQMYVSGNVSVHTGGALDIVDTTVDGGSGQTAANFTPTADHTAISQHFLDKSTEIAAMSDTTGYSDNGSGMLSINVTSGDNVVTIDAATFAYAWGIEIVGPDGATLYVNVPDAGALAFDDIVWWTQGRDGQLPVQRIIVNFSGATAVDMTGIHAADMLMPLANTHFAEGLVIGTFVTGDLTGGGQVNVRTVIPEPATLLLTLSALAGAAAWRRRRRNVGRCEREKVGT